MAMSFEQHANEIFGLLDRKRAEIENLLKITLAYKKDVNKSINSAIKNFNKVKKGYDQDIRKHKITKYSQSIPDVDFFNDIVVKTNTMSQEIDKIIKTIQALKAPTYTDNIISDIGGPQE